MRVVEQIRSTPIDIPLTTRAREIRRVTSLRAGKIACHAAIPVLREDRVSRGSVRLTARMSETVHPLLNAVALTARAVFVPYSAFERFGGSIDKLNRSYMLEKDREADAAPIPFCTTMAFVKTAPFWKTLGVHWPEGTQCNAAYVEAYNVYVNWMRAKASKTLPARLMNDTSLAQAFWNHPLMWHVKADFDQAMMDGEVLLSVNNAVMPVQGSAKVPGIVQSGNFVSASADASIYQVNTGYHIVGKAAGNIAFKRKAGNPAGTELDMGVDLSQAYVELEAQGLRLSLANMELAKQIVAWAKTREQYKGIDAEWLKDMLMQGFRVPDEAMKQPTVLAVSKGIFGYTERHAMDGDSLDKSVTTGVTSVTLNFETPPLNAGGIILILSEIVPEQMFERMEDNFLGITSPDQFPNAKNDFLDPEKVEEVKNRHVDVLHGTPNGLFGYAPLNHAWKGSSFGAGGKFYRPVPDTFVEDRQRFWSVETPNPALNSTFYLVPSDLPHSVFADTLADAFEVYTEGAVEFVGLTQFGKVFDEDDGNYEAVSEGIEFDRISQE